MHAHEAIYDFLDRHDGAARGKHRLLLDAEGGSAEVDDLLLDLELVLIQIAAVAETGSMDDAQARTELELALRTLEDGEVLPRIQAALPQLSGV